MKSMLPNLRETLLTTLVAALYFIVLNWAASCRCLGTVSDSLADLQDKTLDLVSRLEYRRTGPKLAEGYPPVRLVQVDEQTMRDHSAGTYVFNRASLARLVDELDHQSPRAVFIDLDLSNPTNEPITGPQLSAGDLKLLASLRRPRSYPILLPTVRSAGATTLLGRPVASLGLSGVCFVSPFAIRDQDQQVRRIPRPVDPRDPYPAAEALFQLAKGQPCPRAQESLLGGNLYRSRDAYGGRMVFRELPLWQGLLALSGSSVLEGKTPGLFDQAIVIIGRTDPASLDQYPTPVGLLPGVVIHTNELLTLLSYGRNLQTVSPLLGGPLAFAFTLLALLFTPLLSQLLLAWLERLWARMRGVKPSAQEPRLNFLERPLMWTSFFLISAWMLHRSGLFLDYIFPIVGLELSRITRERKAYQLFSRVFRWALRSR